MKNDSITTQEIQKIIESIADSALKTWLKENQIPINVSDHNEFLKRLQKAIQKNDLTLENLAKAVGEIEECGGKKIYVKQLKEIATVTKNRSNLLKKWREKKIEVTQDEYLKSKAGDKSTFIYCNWNENQIKIKYAETHYDAEPDYENERVDLVPRLINIVLVIDLNDGFVQIRFDKAGDVHKHKSEGKSTEAVFEAFYLQLFQDLFDGYVFQELDFAKICNHIAFKEKARFRLNKEVMTISNNLKQTFSGTVNDDIRMSPEHIAAEAAGINWLTEDLTGYWLSAQSQGNLARNLFMRISRRTSQVRVQRDCLENELNYGLNEIRKI